MSSRQRNGISEPSGTAQAGKVFADRGNPGDVWHGTRSRYSSQMKEAALSVGVFYEISEAVKWIGLESLVDNNHAGPWNNDCELRRDR